MPEFRVSGWIKQKPDARDYLVTNPFVAKFFLNMAKAEDLPEKVDLTELYPDDIPEIYDQQDLGSCTANAGKFLVDFLEHRTHGQFLDGSRLFLYYNSRDQFSKNQDVGATIRDTMAALGTYGIVPESWWPYDTTKFAIQPPSKDYDEGLNYKATSYVLIDQPNLSYQEKLDAMMQQLHLGLPMEFGSEVFGQIMKVGPDGRIALPEDGESRVGGHALALVAYDKNFVNLDGSKGAFKIRNSWGKVWGLAGYGWLPFSYFKNLASDVWVLVSEGWVTPTPAPDPTPAPKPNVNPIYTAGIILVLLILVVIFLIRGS